MNVTVTQEQNDYLSTRMGAALAPFVGARMDNMSRMQMECTITAVFQQACQEGVIDYTPRPIVRFDHKTRSCGFVLYDPRATTANIYQSMRLGNYDDMLELCKAYPDRSEWLHEEWRLYERSGHMAESMEQVELRWQYWKIRRGLSD